jgi:uncharacterized damage-inducible protein DinB
MVAGFTILQKPSFPSIQPQNSMENIALRSAERYIELHQETISMKSLLLLIALIPACVTAQTPAPEKVGSQQINPDKFDRDGIWEGYDGEWRHVSEELLSLAEAIPADKYSWRPAKGVRSVSEVIMHIAVANFYLLSVTGPKMPPELNSDTMEETVTSKPEVISYLKRSLEAVKTARTQLKPGDLNRKVKIEDKTVTVDGMYLRIIVHDNEHEGQLIAYARFNGIVPPWSK